MPWASTRPQTLVVGILFGVSCCLCASSDDFKTVDVTKLAALTQGTELLLIENSQSNLREYRLEDFFWTGSGDGAIDNSWQPETPSTIYRTKTVLSTVYVETPSTIINQTAGPKCNNVSCDGPMTPDGIIQPTPAFNTSIPEIPTGNLSDADRQFWLVTVLKSDGKDPVILDLKNSLAKLYKKAFQRQQERHLGINGRTKREAVEKPVNVFIHKIAKTPVNGDEKIEVLYHVAVSGRPVDATTAAADMRLVSDDEVISELGYPFLIKAEPYIKSNEPQSLTSAHSTWLFIGTSLAALLVFLLAVAFLSLCINKKKRRRGFDNRKQVFKTGTDNFGFVSNEEQGKKTRYPRKNLSPSYINFRRATSNETMKSGVIGSRPGSSISATSVSSSSLDISPLMDLNRKSRNPYMRKPRPMAAINKTAPLTFHRHANLEDSDSSCSTLDQHSPDTIVINNFDPGVVSPKSYLSMPSVKSFPRGNIPEPLNKVLEPVSVHHLDLSDDGMPDEPDNISKYSGTQLVRHGSMGTEEDPGVVGPVVWSMYREKLQHGISVDEGLDEAKAASNVARMRKRFHDLLDDTFSLFGSRRDLSSAETKESNKSAIPVEVKSHSAVNRMNDSVQAALRPRPKTSDPRRTVPSPGSDPPKGAWTSHAPSPLVRPLSAGIIPVSSFTPRVDVDHILAEGRLHPKDPAVPLIAAIKTEIQKCSLPGSTTNIAE